MGPIIGIDLGTTTSEIAIFRDGKPFVLKNPYNSRITSSVVGVDPETLKPLVGKPDDGFYGLEVVREVKRKMGSNEKIELCGKQYSPEEVSSFILRYLKEFAEEEIGEPVVDAVITVPANFSIEARKATEIAAKLAGIEPLRIIQEPTAAAIAYSANRLDCDETILVYDLGGGTFDVSLIEVVDGDVDVIAHEGERALGGKDFDQAIIDYTIEEIKALYGEELQINFQKMPALKLAAKQAKEALSFAHITMVRLNTDESIATKRDYPIELNMEITRERFESLTTPLIRKTIKLTEAVVRRAGIDKEEITKVILVGGSTRMPMVRKELLKCFGVNPSNDVEPDLAVALGACIQASIIKGEYEKIVMDRVAYSFGIESANSINGRMIAGYYSEIIPPNTSMLKKFTSHYVTTYPNQEKVLLQCFQKEPSNNSRWTKDCVAIGPTLQLSGIPRNATGCEAIDVTMTYNLDGIIDVETQICSTGEKSRFQIETNVAAAINADSDTRSQNLHDFWAESKYAGKTRAFITSTELLLAEMTEQDSETCQNLLLQLKEAVREEILSEIEVLMDEITQILVRYDSN